MIIRETGSERIWVSVNIEITYDEPFLKDVYDKMGKIAAIKTLRMKVPMISLGNAKSIIEQLFE